ncbi:MAG: molybdenum cofactor biosynthesis protein MoaE [Alcanivorax sp.]|jgi:molybdopterin synthase catalytic subunit
MISVQQDDFDVGDQYRRLCEQAGEAGAVVFFVGRVRGGEGTVRALELEHYPGMCERQLQGFVDEARRRWDCRAVRLVHRVGRLAAGEQIVFVAVATRHRAEAFQAAHFLIDQLKTRAPFWKKEHGPDGARWLDAGADDVRAAGRWYHDAVAL